MVTGNTKPNNDIDSAPTKEMTLCSCGTAAAKPPRENEWWNIVYLYKGLGRDLLVKIASEISVHLGPVNSTNTGTIM